MASHDADLDDYLNLFAMYGEDLGTIYQDPEDDRYAFLFEQVCKMLTQPSPFNLRLPEQFRTSAYRYLDGDPKTVAHLGDPANRHFMLCDLHDLVKLKNAQRRLAKRNR